MNKYATGVGGGVLDAPLALVNPKGRGVETPPPTYISHNYSLNCLTRQPPTKPRKAGFSAVGAATLSSATWFTHCPGTWFTHLSLLRISNAVVKGALSLDNVTRPRPFCNGLQFTATLLPARVGFGAKPQGLICTEMLAWK